MKGRKKIFHPNSNQERAGVALLISGKINFKSKTVRRNKERHHIMIKSSIYQEDTVIIYAPNIRASQKYEANIKSEERNRKLCNNSRTSSYL